MPSGVKQRALFSERQAWLLRPSNPCLRRLNMKTRALALAILWLMKAGACARACDFFTRS
jgi:hypothetical protein